MYINIHFDTPSFCCKQVVIFEQTRYFELADLFSTFGLPPFCQNEACIYRITQALKRLIY